MQLGAIGITCAKVSEAEVMVDHGIPSILVANEQGRRQKFDRLAALNRRAEVITCADSPAHVGHGVGRGRSRPASRSRCSSTSTWAWSGRASPPASRRATSRD